MGNPVNIIGALSRNYLMNSMMQYTQRLGVVSGTLTTTPTVRIQDRWLVSVANVSHFTSAAVGPTALTNPTSGISRSALNFSSQANNAAAEGQVAQRIEALHAKELAGKKASLSFLIRNNNFTTVGLRLYYPGGTDNWGSRTLFYTATPQVLTANSTVKLVKFENIPIHALVTQGLMVEIVYSGFSVGVADDTALSEVMLSQGEGAIAYKPFCNWDQAAELNMLMTFYQVRRQAWQASGRVSMELAPQMRATPVITIISSGGVVITTDDVSAINWTHTKDANNNTYVVSFAAEL